MGKYSTIGMYGKYKKANKEREANDYYATKPEEVRNILETAGINLDGYNVLEPCAGEGYMLKGIEDYIAGKGWKVNLYGGDIKYREKNVSKTSFQVGEDMDFLGDNYKIPWDPDWIIMNPPYSIAEPFTIRALEMANKGLVILVRLQFLEGKGRFENIFKDNPPNDVYVYVDRIKCYKNGNFSDEKDKIQAYCWIIWDKSRSNKTLLHWIRKAE